MVYEKQEKQIWISIILSKTVKRDCKISCSQTYTHIHTLLLTYVHMHVYKYKRFQKHTHSECDQFGTDGHFQKCQCLKACENKWFDVMLYDLLWGVPLSVLKVYTIWLPLLFIYIRIHEMFNVTDGRDKNVGVEFLLLFFHFNLKSLDSPNIFNYRC